MKRCCESGVDSALGLIPVERGFGFTCSLTAAAHEWSAADRDPGFLLRGSRLVIFEDWWENTDLSLTQLERHYLEASLEERRKRRAQEEARQKKEKALERRWRYILSALVVVLAVATVGALGLASGAPASQFGYLTRTGCLGCR